jgi:hypothetical protein
LRVVGVMILLLIAAVAGAIGFAIVFGVVAAVLTQAGAGAVVGVLGSVVMIVLLWVMLRLSLVLPVASVEPNLGVERSWSLMKGNSLRMLLAILLTFVPFGFALSFVVGALLGPDTFQSFPQFDPNNREAFQGAMMAWLGGMMEKMAANWPVIAVASTVMSMLSSALWAGLLGRAYRAVTNMDGE